MTYDQQKREAIANAKHLVELLEEISDEHPGATGSDRYDMERIANRITVATMCALTILERENNP